MKIYYCLSNMYSYICTFLILQAQSDNIKLQLRVEELQHKCEPKGNDATTEDEGLGSMI